MLDLRRDPQTEISTVSNPIIWGSKINTSLRVYNSTRSPNDCSFKQGQTHAQCLQWSTKADVLLQSRKTGMLTQAGDAAGINATYGCGNIRLNARPHVGVLRTCSKLPLKHRSTCGAAIPRVLSYIWQARLACRKAMARSGQDESIERL